jgi:hypothetical protein
LRLEYAFGLAFSPRGLQQTVDGSLQNWQLERHRSPDALQLNPEIGVHEHISNGNNGAPFDFRLQVLQVVRKISDGLSDNDQVPRDGRLYHIRVQIAAVGNEFSDAAYRLLDLAKV